jgi:hypothetical protein
MLCGDDHGLFYCLDIVITNNKKDRRGNCTNGQDLGGSDQVSAPTTSMFIRGRRSNYELGDGIVKIDAR